MIKIGSAEGKPGRIQQWYYKFVMRRDRAVLDDLKSRDLFHPRLTIAKMVAFLFAGLIHSITVILPLIGLWMIISRFAGYFSFCYGILLFGVAYVIRPQFYTRPKSTLSREKFPALYEFVDQIADSLNTPHIDEIVIDVRFNAGFSYFGFRRTSFLFLGYPLWMQLHDQERVALIGHELAHQMNKDFTHTFFVGSALNSLTHWMYLTRPDELNYRRLGLHAVIGNFFMWIVTGGIQLIYIGLSQILLYEKRRAEYLADYIGSSVSGTSGAIDVLNIFQRHQQSITVNTLTDHPSNEYRLEFLRSKAELPPKYVLDLDYSNRIDKELSVLRESIEAEMKRLQRLGYIF